MSPLREQGRIEALFIRPTRETPLGLSAASLSLQAGLGIKSDMHARTISPRQILVVRSEDLQDFSIPPGALGENLLISGISPEAFQPGALLTAGSAGIRLTLHCEPCKVIKYLVQSLKDIAGHRGLLGVVVSSGTINPNHEISCEPGRYEPLPEKPWLRFAHALSLIPAGQVVTYKQLMIAMGVASSYARALPGYFPKVATEGLPIHRIVDSRGQLITAHVPKQAALLASEGVRFEDEQVDLERYAWHEPSLFLG